MVDALRKQFYNKTDDNKVVSLLFDEISIKENFQYDVTDDRIVGFVDNGHTRTNIPSTSILVCMMTGINIKFKQVVGYWLTAGADKNLDMHNVVMESITKIVDAGLIVKSIICDQGPKNQGLARKLNINVNRTYFIYNNVKIFFFYDPPHLLKSVRNNLNKYDLLYKGNLVKWSFIKQVALDIDDPLKLKLLPKINHHHIYLSNFKSMKVKYAAQIFSDSMNTAMSVYMALQKLEAQALHTANFISDMNKLFDSFNSNKCGKEPHSLRYALSQSSPHLSFLDDMLNNFNECRFVNAKRPACINGWIISIKSLIGLFNELSSQYNISKLLTRRLNQDPLENYFSIVRQQNGGCRNPTVSQFQYSLRQTLISNVSKICKNSNCEDDNNYFLLSLKSVINHEVQPTNTFTHIDIDCEGVTEQTAIEDNAVYYVAGYVTMTFLNRTHKCSSCKDMIIDQSRTADTDYKLFTSFKMYENLHDGQGLVFVKDHIFNIIKSWEASFQLIFKQFIYINDLKESLFQYLKKNSPDLNICCTDDFTNLFLKLYIKMKINWSLRNLNRIKENKSFGKDNQKLRNLCNL